METGTIKSFDRDTRIGLIEPSGFSKDVLFTASVVVGGTAWVSPGVPVEYELYGEGGEPEAKMVRKA